jgi:hypothetical protein
MSLVGMRMTLCGMRELFEKEKQFHVVAGNVYIENGE